MSNCFVVSLAVLASSKRFIQSCRSYCYHIFNL